VNRRQQAKRIKLASADLGVQILNVLAVLLGDRADLTAIDASGVSINADKHARVKPTHSQAA
jgi:hypothetical protein